MPVDRIHRQPRSAFASEALDVLGVDRAGSGCAAKPVVDR
jgi:hypothetical protein